MNWWPFGKKKTEPYIRPIVHAICKELRDERNEWTFNEFGSCSMNGMSLFFGQYLTNFEFQGYRLYPSDEEREELLLAIEQAMTNFISRNRGHEA